MHIFDFLHEIKMPKERTLKKVEVDDAVEADRVFSMLMGDEVGPRREFIEEHAKLAELDI